MHTPITTTTKDRPYNVSFGKKRTFTPLNTKTRMKNRVILFLLSLLQLPLLAQPRLSEEASVSLLTSAPYEEEIFTVYGHTALRVHDPAQGIDYIFNYGLFDFSTPHFAYRFAKGDTYYKLGVANFPDYVIEYQMRGSAITEQELNLSLTEKERLWEALLVNYRPENRVYRYDFFFDNCATRPAVLIEKSVDGQIDYRYPYPEKTFRELINHCTRNHPWLTFGCDLALGSPTDRQATRHEMMFLPEYLRDAVSGAIIMAPDGTTRPLVKRTQVIEAAEPDDPEKSVWDWLTPTACAWILFALIAALTVTEWRKEGYFLAVDCALFLLAGIGGVIMFFLCFLSSHSSIWPNWSIVWLHPFHLIAVILFCVKKGKKAAYYYHFINFAALTLLLLGIYFIPQHLNSAFIPLVASIWLRSGWGVYRMKWKNG